jgi:hypothetical protein
MGSIDIERVGIEVLKGQDFTRLDRRVLVIEENSI